MCSNGARRMTRLCELYPVLSLIIVFLWTFTNTEACSTAWIQLTIQHDGCIPRRVMAKGCRGMCTSYTRPSQDVPGQLERFCQCCDVDRTRVRRPIIFCPNSDNSQYRGITVELNVPQSCRCRPCTELPDHVIPAEQEFLQNGKRGSDFKVMNYTKESSSGPLNDRISLQTNLESNYSDFKLRRDILIKQNKPYIFVEGHALNFTIQDAD